MFVVGGVEQDAVFGPRLDVRVQRGRGYVEHVLALAVRVVEAAKVGPVLEQFAAEYALRFGEVEAFVQRLAERELDLVGVQHAEPLRPEVVGGALREMVEEHVLVLHRVCCCHVKGWTYEMTNYF